jgi:hypothetical protein
LEERNQLESNLRSGGCREPLVVWKGRNILLDGHNRFEICQEYAIAFETVEVEIEDKESAIAWIIDNQLGRRNLTPEMVSYLRGKKYNLEKQQGKRTDLTSRQNGDKLTSGQSGTKSTSGQSGDKLSQKLANDYQVGSRTIERDAQYASAVDTLAEVGGSDVRSALLNRSAKLTKKETLNLAKIAQESPEEAQSLVKDLTNASRSINLPKHIKMTPGRRVEIHAPNNPKIHERYGRVERVGEHRIEIWVRDTETMEMKKYQLKFSQVEAVPLEKEPQFQLVEERIERLRGLNLDPFERDLLNLLERTVVLTPTELKYLRLIEGEQEEK